MKAFQTAETVEACPGCASRSFVVAYSPDICRCQTCRLLFRNPRPTQAEIAAAYDQGDTYEEWHKLDAHYTSLWERRIKLVKSYAPSGRLLDVGVGDGGFLAAATTAGYTCEGTELSQTGAGFAQEKGITVRLGQFTGLEWPAANFDVITIWHVLEHLPDPGAAIQHAWRVLKPGGWLFVAVPNETHTILRHRLFGRRPTPFGPLVPGCEIHLSHFQPRTLEALLQRTGFEVRRLAVDDFYPDRSAAQQWKVACYQMLARLTRWHCAACMLAIARKPQ
jgi:2-polyprenyl-3-methyl-5-hydroxy-6-metoxy-1,4-benzoquinol methylase